MAEGIRERREGEVGYRTKRVGREVMITWKA